MAGGGPLPLVPFDVEFFDGGPGAMAFRILEGTEPVLLAGVAWSDEGTPTLWHWLEGEYSSFAVECPQLASSPMDAPPDSAPWLAVLMLPGLYATSPENVSLLGDLEPALAWAVLESAADLPQTPC